MLKNIVILIVLTNIQITNVYGSDQLVIESFRNYRNALEQEDISVLGYFSRGYLEEWLDAVVNVKDENVSHNINVIKKEIKIGTDIDNVYSYEVREISNDRILLKISYSSHGDDDLRKIIFTYKKNSPNYLIDGMERYFKGFGKRPSTAIERFK